jgi:hypothetical protein
MRKRNSVQTSARLDESERLLYPGLLLTKAQEILRGRENVRLWFTSPRLHLAERRHWNALILRSEPKRLKTCLAVSNMECFFGTPTAFHFDPPLMKNPK